MIKYHHAVQPCASLMCFHGCKRSEHRKRTWKNRREGAIWLLLTKSYSKIWFTAAGHSNLQEAFFYLFQCQWLNVSHWAKEKLCPFNEAESFCPPTVGWRSVTSGVSARCWGSSSATGLSQRTSFSTSCPYWTPLWSALTLQSWPPHSASFSASALACQLSAWRLWSECARPCSLPVAAHPERWGSLRSATYRSVRFAQAYLLPRSFY